MELCGGDEGAHTVAQRAAPPSEPAKRWFLRPSAIGLIARSTGLLSSSMRPSSRKRHSADQRRSHNGSPRLGRCARECAPAASGARASSPRQVAATWHCASSCVARRSDRGSTLRSHRARRSDARLRRRSASRSALRQILLSAGLQANFRSGRRCARHLPP